MASIDALCAAILQWAAINGILVDYMPIESAGDTSLVPFDEECVEFFRTRKIVRVDVTPDSNTVLLFSRLPIAIKKKARLESLFQARYGDDGLTLRVKETSPHTVSNRLQQYGEYQPLKVRDGYICCGSSIGLGNQRNAGTLGALVHRKHDKEELFGITCNHVTGGCSTARPGTPVVVPGISDVSSEHNQIHVIGDHESAGPMAQGLPSVRDTSVNTDFAYFKLRANHVVSSQQGIGEYAYDTPTTLVKTPKVGMAVKKWGRSTGFTTGEVIEIRMTDFPISYDIESFYSPVSSQKFTGTVFFNKLIVVQRRGKPFSLPGDSGALVVTDTGNKSRAVGIIIAGNKNESLVFPLSGVLAQYGFSLAGEIHTDA